MTLLTVGPVEQDRLARQRARQQPDLSQAAVKDAMGSAYPSPGLPPVTAPPRARTGHEQLIRALNLEGDRYPPGVEPGQPGRLTALDVPKPTVGVAVRPSTGPVGSAAPPVTAPTSAPATQSIATPPDQYNTKQDGSGKGVYSVKGPNGEAIFTDDPNAPGAKAYAPNGRGAVTFTDTSGGGLYSDPNRVNALVATLRENAADRQPTVGDVGERLYDQFDTEIGTGTRYGSLGYDPLNRPAQQRAARARFKAGLQGADQANTAAELQQKGALNAATIGGLMQQQREREMSIAQAAQLRDMQARLLKLPAQSPERAKLIQDINILSGKPDKYQAYTLGGGEVNGSKQPQALALVDAAGNVRVVQNPGGESAGINDLNRPKPVMVDGVAYMPDDKGGLVRVK